MLDSTIDVNPPQDDNFFNVPNLYINVGLRVEGVGFGLEILGLRADFMLIAKLEGSEGIKFGV